MLFRSVLKSLVLFGLPLGFILETTSAAEAQMKSYWGEGAAPCSKYTTETEQKTVLGSELSAWVRGYITGANVMQTYTDNVFEMTDAELDNMTNWIDDYCRRNPNASLVAASDLLIKERITNILAKPQ
jgi:hypothetical protein